MAVDSKEVIETVFLGDWLGYIFFCKDTEQEPMSIQDYIIEHGSKLDEEQKKRFILKYGKV